MVPHRQPRAGYKYLASMSSTVSSRIGTTQRKSGITRCTTNSGLRLKCYVDTRKKLYADVVLSLGTTIFRGMVERMTNELTALISPTMRSRWLLRFGMYWRVYLVHELPDRNIITVGIERFCCVEMISQPSFAGNKSQRSPRHLFPEQHETRRLRSCTLMSCCQAARPCSEKLFTASRMN